MASARANTWIPAAFALVRMRWDSLLAIAAAFLIGGVCAALVLQTNLPARLKAKIVGVASTDPVGDTRDITWQKLETGLLTVELAEIPLGDVDGEGTGGGVVQFADTLLFSSPRGRLGYLSLLSGELSYTDVRPPLNLDGLKADPAWQRIIFNRNWFRVHDLALVPTGPDASDLYVSHHVYRDGTICTVISRMRLGYESGEPLFSSDWETIYEVDPCIDLADVSYSFDGHMSGGRMAVEDENTLLLTVGDFGFGGRKGRDERVIAGSANDLAKLIRLDLVTGQTSIVAEGLRNSQGLVIDDMGQIWSTDHAAQGGDEVNLIQAGADYGWPKVALGFEYGEYGQPRTPILPNPVQGRHDDFESPIYAFMPSIGISNLLRVPGDSDVFGLWAGDLLVTSLKAQTIYRLRVDGDQVIYSEPIGLDRTIRDVVQLADGRIAMLTDEHSLLLMRDAAKAEGEILSLSGYDIVNQISADIRQANPKSSGRDLFRWKCGRCHSVDDVPNVGPSLKGIGNRPIGTQEGYAYSTALREAEGRWTRKRIAAYLEDPAAAGFDGTSMPAVPDVNDWMLREILDYANKGEP